MTGGGTVSKTFRRELKIDLVWQRANKEAKGLAVSVKWSRLLPQLRLHGNESCLSGRGRVADKKL